MYHKGMTTWGIFRIESDKSETMLCWRTTKLAAFEAAADLQLWNGGCYTIRKLEEKAEGENGGNR